MKNILKYLIAITLLFGCGSENKESKIVEARDTTNIVKTMLLTETLKIDNNEKEIVTPSGTIRYTIQNEMSVDSYYKVKISISRTIFDSLKIIKSSKIKITDEMSVILKSSDDFEIQELSNNTQPVEELNWTDWEWRIKPKSIGYKEIRSIAISYNEDTPSKDQLIFDEVIDVSDKPLKEYYFTIFHDELKLNKTSNVRLVISKNPISSNSIKYLIGEIQTIRLISPNSDINILFQNDKLELKRSLVEFDWQITPKKLGDSYIKIELVDDRSYQEVFNEEIKITSNVVEIGESFYEKYSLYLNWLSSILIVPAFLVIKKWIKFRNMSKSTSKFLKEMISNDDVDDFIDKVEHMSELDVDYGEESTSKNKSVYSNVCRFIKFSNDEFLEDDNKDINKIKEIYNKNCKRLQRHYLFL